MNRRAKLPGCAHAVARRERLEASGCRRGVEESLRDGIEHQWVRRAAAARRAGARSCARSSAARCARGRGSGRRARRWMMLRSRAARRAFLDRLAAAGDAEVGVRRPQLVDDRVGAILEIAPRRSTAASPRRRPPSAAPCRACRCVSRIWCASVHARRGATRRRSPPSGIGAPKVTNARDW